MKLVETNKQIFDDPVTIISALKIRDAIGYRGFISSIPEMSLRAFIAAMERGFMYWGQKIYLVKNLMEAEKHHNDSTQIDGHFNSMMTSFYLISNLTKDKLNGISRMANDEIKEIFLCEARNGVYFYYKKNWMLLSGDQLTRFTDVLLMKSEDGYFFYQRGWFSPEVRGVICFEDLNNSKTINNIYKISRNLYRNGYYVSFNRDLLSVIRGCKEQQRKGQNFQNSRITDDFIKTYQQLQNLGKTYSVELRDPVGQVVAGTFGFRSGSVFGNESIFYPLNITNSEEGYKSKIDCAKVAFLALIERLKKAGFAYLDVGMVSGFTRNSFKAKYITREEFLDMFNKKPNDIEIDFFNDWNPENLSFEV